MAGTAYYRRVDSGVLTYRENRDRAAVEIRNIVRRIANEVNDYISLEMLLAEREDREVAIDLSADGLRQLLMQVTIKELGGGVVAASDDQD